MTCHWSRITLGHHAGHMLFGFSLDPHRVTIQQQQVVGFGLGYHSTADTQDYFVLAVNDAFQTATLDASVSGLAVQEKDLRQADARLALDLLIQLHEWSPHTPGQTLTQGRFARTAQADQGDAPATNNDVLTKFGGQSL